MNVSAQLNDFAINLSVFTSIHTDILNHNSALLECDDFEWIKMN